MPLGSLPPAGLVGRHPLSRLGGVVSEDEVCRGRGEKGPCRVGEVGVEQGAAGRVLSQSQLARLPHIPTASASIARAGNPRSHSPSGHPPTALTRAGALEAEQRLQHRVLLVQPAALCGRLEHRVLAWGEGGGE